MQLKQKSKMCRWCLPWLHFFIRKFKPYSLKIWGKERGIFMEKEKKVTTIQQLVQKMEDLKMPFSPTINVWIDMFKNEILSKQLLCGYVEGYIFGLESTNFISSYERELIIHDLHHFLYGA